MMALTERDEKSCNLYIFKIMDNDCAHDDVDA